MATNYKANAAEAKKAVASLPKEQQAAAAKVIAQATKTGQGLSNNELAYLKANASKLSATTDPKTFLGTLEQRQSFLQSQGQTAENTSSNKTATNTSSYINASGQRVEVTSWSDGTRTENNLGMDSGVATQRVNWIEQLNDTFAKYGLGSLASKITEYVQSGFSADTVSLKLQETPEYQQRFAGNEARKKMGLPVLTPGEYLSAESSYKQIMRANGLPQGFYDSQESLAKFISNDVSPSEFQSRVNAAGLSLNNADPFYTQSLQEMYGLTQGEMLAHVLDPQQALPFINKQVQAAQFGAEARRQGLSLGAPVAEQYANMGVTQKEAQQGFQQVAQIMPTANTLSGIYKNQAGPYGQEQAIAEAFGGEGAAEASLRRKKLSALETANFSGSSGTGKSSFAQQQTGQI